MILLSTRLNSVLNRLIRGTQQENFSKILETSFSDSSDCFRGLLTLFRPGGARILPARTLDVYNFFNKQAKATELGDFS